MTKDTRPARDTRTATFATTRTGNESLEIAFVSDVGCVRSNNEDSGGFFYQERVDRGVLLIVADGMGGEDAGEVASRMAVEHTANTFFSDRFAKSPEDALERGILASNHAIRQAAEERVDVRRMGTTCTAVAVVGSKMWFGHVGDSRAYVAKQGALAQVTEDHSLAAEIERGGAQVAPSKTKNMLTRCVGIHEPVEVDTSPMPHALVDGSVILLCSDGLSNLVDDSEILSALMGADPVDACGRLVDLAMERGAPDNVTALVARLRVR